MGKPMSGTGPTSEQEFKRALEDLIIQAAQNNVHIDDGGYEFKHENAEIPDVEVLIVRLAESHSASE